jgi:hypothetical protein
MGEVVPYPEWRDLLEKTKETHYGKVIAHEEIEKITGLQRDTGRWKTTICRWKTKMRRDFNRVVVSVPKIGYRVIEPKDHLLLCRKIVRHGVKRIALGREIIVHVDRMALSVEMLREVDNHIHRLGQIVAVNIYELKELSGRQSPISLPRILPA